MQKRMFPALAAVLSLLCGCSSQQNATRPAGAVKPLRNPLDFALYPGASVVSTHAFTQNVVVQNAGSAQSVFSGGSGTYAGHEVIASSAAPFSALSSWVARLSVTPPAGYTPVENGQVAQERDQATQYGLDYAAFKKKQGNRTRGVLVIVMDPQRVNERFGRVLGMIAKYRALPAIMRGPIDQQAKERLGMSLTEATQPDSPIGASLAALDQFEHKNARGIVVIDAAKQ